MTVPDPSDDFAMSPAPLDYESPSIASSYAAPQHRPRPLPLFLEILRSETAGSPARTRKALEGLRRYQQAERPPPPEPMPIVARAGRTVVRDYGGAGRPVLFVPSLINPPNVLDLAEGNSLLRWLATRGLRPLLLDWGEPSPEERDLSVGGHVEELLLPIIEAIGGDLILAGYCIGGTMTLAAAALRPVHALVLIAAPWRFSGFPDTSRANLLSLWHQAEPVSAKLGALPMEVLQTSFWQLDPRRTIAKFEAFADMPPDSPAARGFVALEDWANDGPPLTYAAGRELLQHCFGDDLPGTGRWLVGGEAIDPQRITCPVLNIVSMTDRIVPAASAAELGERWTLGSGHVGMIVGRSARMRLWEPLAGWLSQLRDS
jgi:polyhydroxyalkanoate synthase